MKPGLSILLTLLFILPLLPDNGGSSGFRDTLLHSDPIPAGLLTEIPLDDSDVFVENGGQWDPNILFVTSTGIGKTALCKDGILHQVFEREGCDPFDVVEKGETDGRRYDTIGIAFEGGSPTSVAGEGKVGTVFNFFLGNDPSRWALGLSGYESVLYSDVWPGISIRYYHKDGCLKYDILLSPGADPDAIGFDVKGAESVCISEGSIVMRTSVGMAIADSPPIASYLGGGRIGAAFRLEGTRYGFDLDPYDREREVVIDPSYNEDALSFSTFIGDSGVPEYPTKMDVDAVGNVFITGSKNNDVFVFKLDRTGKSLVYATYIGGNQGEAGTDIKVNSGGNAYVAGFTSSNNFPCSNGAYSKYLKGASDLFLCRLDPSGGSLEYSTYIGGSQNDRDPSIDLDFDGNVYLAARTVSQDFPVSSNAYQNSLRTVTNPDLALVKFNLSSMSLLYSTFLGGSYTDIPYSIVYESGNVTVVGNTQSSDFNITGMAYQMVRAYGVDAFVLEFDIIASILVYSTFFGGNGNDYLTDLRLDSNGDVVACGYSSSSDLPSTTGAMDSTLGGSQDGIIVCIGSNGTNLKYSTYVGWNDQEVLTGIDLDSQMNIHVTGWFTGTGLQFETTLGGLQETPGKAGFDVIYIEIKKNASGIIYSTFLGGEGRDEGYDIFFDQVTSEPIIMGMTGSSDFPVKNGSYDTTCEGGYDARDIFVSKFTLVRLPKAPTNLSGFSGYSFAELRWRAPNEDGGDLVNYTIWRGIDANKTDLMVGTTPNLIFEDTTPENGITYYYAVKARNRAGQSPFSNVVSARPAGVPSPPRDLKVNSVGNRSVELSWKGPENTGGKGIAISNFRMLRSWISGSSHFDIPAPSTKFIDHNLENGVNYSYKLTAVNEIGESKPSVPVYAIPRTVPSIVRDLRTESGDGFVRIFWTEPESDGGSPIIGYSIDRQAAQHTLFTTGPGVTEFNDTGLVNGHSYSYSIRAKNIAGLGPFSETVTGKPFGKPSIPTVFSVEAHPSSAILTWGPPDYDGGSPLKDYNVYRMGDENTWQKVTTLEITESAFTDDTLRNGDTYYYRMTAVNLGGRESDPTAQLQASPLGYPGAVMGLRAVAGDRSVLISWKGPSDDGGAPIIGYRVFRGGSPSYLDQIGILDPEVFFFNDTAVRNGNTYYYRVVAFNSLGNGTPVTSVGVIPTGRPSAPRSVDASAGDGYVDISWEEPDDSGGFPIERVTIYRATGDSGLTPIYTSEISGGNYRDESVENGVRYSYSLSASNAIGEGPRSERVYATPYGIPSAPVNFSTEALSGPSIRLTWSPPETNGGTPVLKYYVYRMSFSWIRIAELPGGNLSYIDSDIKEGLEYHYKVSAVNALGEGPFSEEIVIRTDKGSEGPSKIGWIIAVLTVLILGIGIALGIVITRRIRYSRSEGEYMAAPMYRPGLTRINPIRNDHHIDSPSREKLPPRGVK